MVGIATRFCKVVELRQLQEASLTAEHRQPLSVSHPDHGEPTTSEFCYFSFRPLQLSRTICSTPFLFFLFEMVSHFFYVTVRKYNQPALALRKTTSWPVLWEGILSDWSTKYKGIFKLPARQNLLRLMLQKQRNNLTNHCVRLCLLRVFFFFPQNQKPAEFGQGHATI